MGEYNKALFPGRLTVLANFAVFLYVCVCLPSVVYFLVSVFADLKMQAQLHCYLRYIYPKSIRVEAAFNGRRVKIMKLNRRPYQSN